MEVAYTCSDEKDAQNKEKKKKKEEEGGKERIKKKSSHLLTSLIYQEWEEPEV